MYLVNGQVATSIDIADRGLQYGDGVFETLAVWQSKPLFLVEHLQRLQLGCQKLLIPLPDLTLLSQEVYQLAAKQQRAVIKLIITRGAGGRGYRQPKPIVASRILGVFPYPDYPEQFQTNGVSLRICQQRLAHNPGLAGIKHLNRLEQVLARAEWQDDAWQEGLMLDYQEQVIEGTMSNLFLVKAGCLLTPSLISCGISGIVRSIVIKLAKQLNLAVQETTIDQNCLFNADEVFITNSIIGIWPVTQIAERHFSQGIVTQNLQTLYQQVCADQL